MDTDTQDTAEDQYEDAFRTLQQMERELYQLNDRVDGMEHLIASMADDVVRVRRAMSRDDFEQEVILGE